MDSVIFVFILSTHTVLAVYVRVVPALKLLASKTEL